jgi:hypothetical protein
LTKFSSDYPTFGAWRKAHPKRTAYRDRIELRHALNPRASLRQLRGTRGAPVPARSQTAAYQRSLDALSRMRRDGLTLKPAAKQAGTTPATVRRNVPSALTVGPDGITARPTDRLYREMRFLDSRGLTTVTVNSSRTATEIAEYMNAVERYLNTGDQTDLRQFRGRTITDSAGRSHRFITNTNTLDRFAGAGEARFESIYQFASEGQ